MHIDEASSVRAEERRGSSGSVQRDEHSAIGRSKRRAGIRGIRDNHVCRRSANRAAWAEVELMTGRSRFDDHDFGRLDEGVGSAAFFESQFLAGGTRDDCGDHLIRNPDSDFGEQPFMPNAFDDAEQLVPSAYRAEDRRLVLSALLDGFHLCQAVDFTLRNTVMSSRHSHRTDLALVDPILDGGITYIQKPSRFGELE